MYKYIYVYIYMYIQLKLLKLGHSRPAVAEMLGWRRQKSGQFCGFTIITTGGPRVTAGHVGSLSHYCDLA